MSHRQPPTSSTDATASPAAALPPAALKPLEPGTLFLERYTILELLSADRDTNIYRVAAMQRCPVCGVENDGSVQVCGFCGNRLPPALTRRVIEQRAPENGMPLPSAAFLLSGKVYLFVPDLDGTPDGSPSAVRLTHGYSSDVGFQRGASGEPNQDALGILHLTAQNADGSPALGLYIVADGIGGAQAGEQASRRVVQALLEELNSKLVMPLWQGRGQTTEEIRAALQTAISNANTGLMEWTTSKAMQSGTTLTLALVVEQTAYIANVGDSRTYLSRKRVLTQITRDHSVIAQLVANGAVTTDESYSHPQRNLILKSLGDPSGYEIDLFPEEGEALELHSGDRLLLCSDGLWEMVRDPEIAQVLQDFQDPQAACTELVQLANLAGGMDNITAIVVALE